MEQGGSTEKDDSLEKAADPTEQEMQQVQMVLEAPGKPAPKEKYKKETWEWVKALLIALVLVVIIRWFLFTPFIVEGPSMQPNFKTGERLIVNKVLFDMRHPKHGEVIVFHAPDGRDYIKRVIALPGETVRVEGDQVFVNGKQIKEPYIQDRIDEFAKTGTTYNTLNYAEATVPKNSLFVMGDNRRNSSDSRDPNVGFVPYKKIVGRADLIFWPVNNIKFIKH